MQDLSFRTVDAVRPVAPYIGGKRNLARHIIRIIDATPHDTYAEAFVGMGGVFLRRTKVPPLEVINDLSADVAGFFRVLQNHYQAFMDMIRWQLTGRDEWERLNAMPADRLTDLQRAARFLYLQRNAFGGKVRGRNFGVSLGRGGRFNVTELAPMLQELHQRLAGIIIERLSYDAFLPRYDRAGTLFYLDPPYFGTEGYYGDGFTREDFAKLAGILAVLKGRFIMSINDAPEIRAIFAAFSIEAVETTYTAGGGGKARTAGELIITNLGGRS